MRESLRKPCWWPPPSTPELNKAQVLLLPKLLHRQMCAWLHPLLILAHCLEFLLWHHTSLIAMDSSGNKQSVDYNLSYYNNQSSSALLAQVLCSSLLWNSGTQGIIFKPSPLLTISNICVQFETNHRTLASHSPNTCQHFFVCFTHESRD